MSEEEDDYLSDKFLQQLEASSHSKSSSTPKTYTQRRHEAERISALKNEQNRRKSRKQLEQESREEGLSKSLFERAKEEEESHGGQQNKALAMMMKMGFKPGQALGKDYDDHSDDDHAVPTKTIASPEPPQEEDTERASKTPTVERESGSPPPQTSALKHRTVPLPINEWERKA